SPDVKEAFERALSLLDRVPEHPLRGLVLSVLGLACQVRGEHEQAAAIARRWSVPASSTACWSALSVDRASHATGWRKESARWRSSMRARRGRCSSPTRA